MIKTNCNTIGIFTGAGLNPHQYINKPAMIDGKSILSEFPTAIKAIAIYNDGAEVIRIELPLSEVITYNLAGGSACITGGAYPSLSWGD